jgi:molybdopterin/thiamine biosynthesis adenylyltransferase/rhodanese-related sulfurtransferase
MPIPSHGSTGLPSEVNPPYGLPAMSNPSLSPRELDRYARHLSMPEFGLEGQQRLKESSVLCIGAGGLGSPAAMYLAAAGVGRIGIVDPDQVDRSNLQRQLLHGENSVGQPKTESAAARLRDINPHVEVVLHPTLLTPDNALDIARGYDVILDGCDNFPTRFLTNDTAFLLGIPNVYGSIHRFEGQATVLAPHLGGPCLRCFMPALPPPGSVPSCAEAGVLGVLPGVVGCLQANETIKLLAGIGEPAIGQLLHLDLLRFQFRQLGLKPNPECRLCSPQADIRSPDNAETRASPDCSPPGLAEVPEIDAAALQQRIAAGRLNAILLDVRSPVECRLAAIDGHQPIPLPELDSSLGSLDRDGEIIVYCASGVRSLRAARLLIDRGFEHVSHLSGGIRDWIRSGFPVLRS